MSEDVALKMRIASCGECGRGEWEVSFPTGIARICGNERKLGCWDSDGEGGS